MTPSITANFSSKATPDKNDPMLTCGPIEIAGLMVAIIQLGLSVWDHIFGPEEAKAQPSAPAPAFGG